MGEGIRCLEIKREGEKGREREIDVETNRDSNDKMDKKNGEIFPTI